MQMSTFARSALALSAVVGVIAAAPAHAVVVASGPVSIAIPVTPDGLYLNLVTGASTGAVGGVAGWDINPYTAATGLFNLWGPTTNTWFAPSGLVAGPYPLAAGTSISGAAAAFFRPGGANDVGPQIALNAPNLFGVRFANEALGSAINFAWVEITFGATLSDRRITAWAYENSGAAILAGVGAVPEPSTYAMLLAGMAAVGAAAARRRSAGAKA